MITEDLPGSNDTTEDSLGLAVNQTDSGGPDDTMPAAPARELLTPNEICDLYGLGRTKTYERIRAGAIPGFRIDGRLYVRRGEFEAWLERHRTAGASAAALVPTKE